MATITLISDWRNSDFYLASVKGSILNLAKDANIVDITHQLDSFSITQAAFIAKYSYRNFSPGTIHLIAVTHENETPRRMLAAYYDQHYFLSSDDGLLSLIFENDPEKVIEIVGATEKSDVTTFPEMTHLAYAAGLIANGVNFDELGTPVENYTRLMDFVPQYDGNSITGNVIFIDSYQNAITNIDKELFEKVGKGRRFDILLHSFYYKVNKISKNYADTVDGELLALFNSIGLLEIAQKNGAASELINVTINSSINIKFFS